MLLTNNEINAAMQTATLAAAAAGTMLLEGYGCPQDDNSTSQNGFHRTTVYDKKAHELISEILGSHNNKFPILSEECEKHEYFDAELPYWTEDPLDGTRAFERGIDECTTMLSLIDSGRAVLSVINDFVRQEMYSAQIGSGAYCNQKRINTSGRTLKNSEVTVNINDESIKRNFEERLEKQGVVRRDHAGMGRMFINIARGSREGFISFHRGPRNNIWDFVPGVLLVSEAGGIVTDYEAKPYTTTETRIIAASNEEIHNFMFNALNNSFGAT